MVRVSLERPIAGLKVSALPGSAIVPATSYTILAAITVSALALAGLMVVTGIGLSVAVSGFVTVVVPIAALSACRIALRAAASPASRQFADFCGHMVAFMAICLIGVLASYPAAAETTGFYDPQLARADHLLHFDWVFWYRQVSENRALQLIGSATYAAIYISPVLLLAHFARAQESHSACRFLLSFWLAALLTILLFPLFPAEGPLAFLWHGPIPYMPTSALYQEQLIPALRTHQLQAIDLGALRGLVCAPSFHAAAGVIYIATAWPIARLRWPLGILNLLMLAATPIEGTHYLVDLIAGALVAVTALALVAALTRPQQLSDQGRPTLA